MKIRTGFLCVGVLLASLSARAATLTVPAGGNLQAAINAAAPGDTILLAAGAIFTGNFTLPVKNGSAYITIRSSAADAVLPAAGVRIGPSSAALLPKIRSDENGPALRTVGPATYWRLMFLEILPSVSNASSDLVEFGADTAQTSLALAPQHLVIDRCYLHGDAAFGQRRGVALNSGDAQIINSYFADFKGVNEDTQAVAGWNGPGPFLIDNNYLEAAGENLLFGGSDPSIPGLVPSNITISHNLISKPLAWVSAAWTVKNLVEFKNADTVMVEGNIIENNWAAGQQGYSILFTPRNQDNTAPWTVVQNITIRNNVIRHVAAAFSVLGYDNLATSQQTNHIVIRNNLIYDVSPAYASAGNPANGWVAIISGGSRDITFDHNTIDNTGNDTFVFYASSQPAITTALGVTITNNLMRDNAYGIFGNSSQEGDLSLATYAPDSSVHRNAIAGATAKFYPVDNFYPTLAQWQADFVSVAAANYQLVSSNPWKDAATDGTDIGVNFTTLNAAMDTTQTVTTPPPTPVSAPYTGAAVSLPGRLEAENYDKGGEGIAYHDTTPGNAGGVYRSDDVDIRATSDAGGGYNVKSIRAGEWLNYSVNVAAAGSYAVGIRMASSGPGGTVHLAVDGADVSGPIVLPDTRGWDTWQTVTASGINLPSGVHIITLVVDANGSGGTVADINWLSFTGGTTTVYAGTPYSGTPIALPGRLEAENYDNGGEGIAYHDTTAGNAGNVYRADGVDIRVTSDTGGGYNVKSMRAGEWLNYSVTVASAGSYSVGIRMASSGPGGTVHLAVDGADVSGPVVLPDTHGWDAWQTVTTSGITLPSGAHVIELMVDANGSGGTAADINWLSFTAGTTTAYAGTPYSGTPIALPGRLEVENYDKGGEGVAYHDTTAGNAGGEYRSDGVDIVTASDTGGGYKIKSAVAGEWLNYTVSVSANGSYALDARVCSSGAGGTFHVEVDGVNVTGAMAVPNTGSWNTFTTVTKSGVALTAGTHLLTLRLDSNGATTGMTGNFNWLAIR